MRTIVLSIVAVSYAYAGTPCVAPAAALPQQTNSWSVAAVGGTQGVGMSVGYRMNEYVGFRLRGAVNGQNIAIGAHQVESFIREDGRDFFKIADNLHVYPVRQLSVGLRF